MKRNLGLLVILALVALAYFPINHGLQGGLHLTDIFHGQLDSHLPFVPALALPYLLFIPLFWLTVVYALLTGYDFKQLVLAAIVVYGLSDITYLFLPTEVTRPEHLGGGFFNDLVRYVYSHDRPFCDFPSGHTASAILFMLYWRRMVGRKVFGLILLIGLTVIGSTVLIRQHSVFGALAGVVLAVRAWQAIDYRLTKDTPPATLKS